MSATVATTKRKPRLRPAERGRFLKSLAAGNTARKAASDVGRHHSSFYRHREADEKFAEAWEYAERLGTQALEQVAIERAKDQSDTLLMFLLKKRDPSYRERASVEISGSVQHEHQHQVVSVSAVKHILEEAGTFDGEDARPRGTLAGASQVLPAQSNGQAGRVPADPEP